MIDARRVAVMEGGVIEFESFTLPSPGTGQVLLRALTTLISPGTERAWLLGLPNTSPTFPGYPGYSFVGEVIAAGAEVTTLQEGDRAVCAARHQSHALVDAADCIEAPKNISSEQASFFNMMGIAMQGVRKARIELGESVAVLGAGMVGILSMRLAQLAGGLPVIGIARRLQPLEVAAEVGVDDVIVINDMLQDNLRARLSENGARIVIECTSAPSMVVTAFQLAARGGRVVLVGSSRGEAEAVNFYRDLHMKGLHVIGGHVDARPLQDNSPGFWTERSEHELCLELLSLGRVVIDPLITHRYDWQDFNRAYEHLANWDTQAIGIVINWS